METRSRYQRAPINQFISDLYNQEYVFENYLRKLGFTQPAARYLTKNYTNEIREIVCNSLHTFFVMQHDKERLDELLIRYYGLGTQEKETKSIIAADMGIKLDQIKELVEKAFTIMKEKKAHILLENNLRDKLATILLRRPVIVDQEPGTAEFFSQDGAEEGTSPIFTPKEQKTPGGKTYTVAEVRKKYPRAYAKWSKEEDEELGELWREGKSIRTMAKFFQRKDGAIASRLRKNELKGLRGE